jgi:hypothetical protein
MRDQLTLNSYVFHRLKSIRKPVEKAMHDAYVGFGAGNAVQWQTCTYRLFVILRSDMTIWERYGA